MGQIGLSKAGNGANKTRSPNSKHLETADVVGLLPGLQGFCVYNACGGGTGSGLGCLMLDREVCRTKLLVALKRNTKK